MVDENVDNWVGTEGRAVKRYRWPELTMGEQFTGKEDAHNHRSEYVLASAYDAVVRERDGLRDELDRRKGDPVTRLHNLCENLAEQADESPFTREEWERIDAQNVALLAERNETLKRMPRALAERGMENARVNNDHETWNAFLYFLDPASFGGERLERTLAFLKRIEEERAAALQEPPRA